MPKKLSLPICTWNCKKLFQGLQILYKKQYSASLNSKMPLSAAKVHSTLIVHVVLQTWTGSSFFYLFIYAEMSNRNEYDLFAKRHFDVTLACVQSFWS